MVAEKGKGGYRMTSIVRNKLEERRRTHIRTKSTVRTGVSFTSRSRRRDREVVTLSRRY